MHCHMTKTKLLQHDWELMLQNDRELTSLKNNTYKIYQATSDIKITLQKKHNKKMTPVQGWTWSHKNHLEWSK